MDHKKRFVIIPAYHPDHALAPLTQSICDKGYHLIVVNDGSGEAFDAVFADMDPRATLLTHKHNRGKGAALKTAYAHILDLLQGDTNAIICTADADGQHLPEDMCKVLDAAEEASLAKDAEHHPVLILGVRLLDKHMPFRSRFGNNLTKGIFHFLTGAKVSDTQTGLRAFSAELLPLMLSVEGDRYEYEMNVLTKMAKFEHSKSFVEVPIATIYRDADNSTSHFHPIKDSLRIYRNLFRFAGSSFISFLIDFIAFCLLSYIFGLCMSSWGDLMANISARVISATVNYNLNCRFVFEKKPTAKNALSYGLLCVCILVINSGVLYLWKQTIMPVWFCKLLTEVCMFFVNYLLQKKVVFRKKRRM